jgi:hypothetical protein
LLPHHLVIYDTFHDKSSVVLHLPWIRWTLTFAFLVLGWLTLLTILDELKERPVKRGSELDVASTLAKKVKKVDLGGR